jgi:hypothetical protein
VQTDSTIPNNKPEIIILDNGKRIWKLIDTAISGDINVIRKEAKLILKHKRRKNTVCVECKTKAIAIRSNNGKWKHLKIIQTIPEQHIWKARNQRKAPC